MLYPYVMFICGSVICGVSGPYLDGKAACDRAAVRVEARMHAIERQATGAACTMMTYRSADQWPWRVIPAIQK